MIQDFYAAFGFGDSDKYIAQGDAQDPGLVSGSAGERQADSNAPEAASGLEERLTRFEAMLGSLPQ